MTSRVVLGLLSVALVIVTTGVGYAQVDDLATGDRRRAEPSLLPVTG